jgi:threonine dehydratase
MPAPITSADVDAAEKRIRAWVRRTPVLELGRGAFGADVDLVLKLECLQHTGSFKPRGAFNTVLACEERPTRIVAASGGNHGAAVAHVGAELGIPTDVYVPDVTPGIKRDRIAALGASVHVGGALYDDAQLAADGAAAATGALLIHPYDAVNTIAGQATCGRELLEQAGHLDVIVAAVGGGGFAAGIALACAEVTGTRLVTVEPQTSACLHAALGAGQPVDVPVSGLAADSLGARRVGELNWVVLGPAVSQSVVVPDEAIRAAQRELWRELRLVAEPGGATALAALMLGRIDLAPTERVAVLVCGANTDPATVAA